MTEVESQLASYGESGYLVVTSGLTADQVGVANDAVDRDLVENPLLWKSRSPVCQQNVNVLMARPELDFTMRPPNLLPLMTGIMGIDLCAEEHSVMLRAPNPDGPTECDWHRDRTTERAGPYRTGYLSVVFYLTDVDDSTHTFSVIPGSCGDDDLPDLDTYDFDSAHHITGPAGTAILFNAALFHAGNVRITTAERRTIHIYCGRTSSPPLSEFTIFPPRLWHGEDEPTRKYYSKLNTISNLVLNNT